MGRESANTVDLALVIQLETMTRLGQAQEIAKILDGTVLARTPRELAARLAQICFRNGLYIQCLRTLNPLIRSAVPLDPPLQPQEVISYSSALVSLGMYKEAREHLQKIDFSKEPEALLIVSFSYFGEWNYRRTIPLLRKFIAHPELPFYRKVVGQVNLAAAYVSTQMFEQADQLLHSVLRVVTENNFKLLKGNTLELLAQNEIQKRNYFQALAYLDQAADEIPDANSIYYFFIKKWRCICELLMEPKNGAKQEACRRLKAEALHWRHWETARDVDLYMAFATQDNDLLNRVLLGTPSKYFLAKVTRLYSRPIGLPAVYCFRASSGASAKVGRSLDYTALSLGLVKRPLLRKLFYILTRDFYKPPNLGLLFAELYPDEYFNPQTSEKRILNQIYALRDDLNAGGKIVNLCKDQMDYIFQLEPTVELTFRRHAHRSRYVPSQKEIIIESFGGEAFSAADLAKVQKLNVKRVRGLIQQLVAENFLQQVAGGARTSYVVNVYRKRFAS